MPRFCSSSPYRPAPHKRSLKTSFHLRPGGAVTIALQPIAVAVGLQPVKERNQAAARRPSVMPALFVRQKRRRKVCPPCRQSAPDRFCLACGRFVRRAFTIICFRRLVNGITRYSRINPQNGLVDRLVAETLRGLESGHIFAGGKLPKRCTPHR